ncbi:creatininase family protein [Halorarum salinum]|uniref:Creatininase family protein n=1 Tax=Halorarum salinum TaxID=2743089 RepID=A0A7D5L8Y1_9EURY|nr:creatininase family protein [Halobaculum salinum]QLG60475.1 creatininase family protein [Halobaculum salinum]
MPETESDLFTMTWEDAGESLLTADCAILPTGSVEQHSVHLPLSTDTLRADHLTAELVEAADDHGLEFVRLPTLPYGYSEHHMRFPGTVTLSQDTYKSVLVDVGASLAEHGADRLLFLNCHGGNKEALALASDRLNRDTDLTAHFVHWTDFARDELREHFGEGWGHAGDHETSFVELYRPDLVKEGKKEPQTVEEMPETRSYDYFDDVTEQGGLGDPTNSDPEVMEGVVANTTDRILESLKADVDAGW